MALRTQLDIHKSNKKGEEVINFTRQQIALARKEKFSARALSQKMKYRDSFISEIETGKIIPSFIAIIEIAHILEKPVDYFIDPKYRYRDKKGRSTEQIEEDDREEERRKLTQQLANTYK